MSCPPPGGNHRKNAPCFVSLRPLIFLLGKHGGRVWTLLHIFTPLHYGGIHSFSPTTTNQRCQCYELNVKLCSSFEVHFGGCPMWEMKDSFVAFLLLIHASGSMLTTHCAELNLDGWLLWKTSWEALTTGMSQVGKHLAEIFLLILLVYI